MPRPFPHLGEARDVFHEFANRPLYLRTATLLKRTRDISLIFPPCNMGTWRSSSTTWHSRIYKVTRLLKSELYGPRSARLIPKYVSPE
jgi:hypothetical protein